MNNAQWLQCLREAQRLYNGARYMSKQERYDATVSLAEWGVFSVAQLSQITGWSVTTLRGMNLKKGMMKSGKFNPMGLDTLIALRLNYNSGVESPALLINLAVQEGNSHRVISLLTGVARSTIQRKANVVDNSSSGL